MKGKKKKKKLKQRKERIIIKTKGSKESPTHRFFQGEGGKNRLREKTMTPLLRSYLVFTAEIPEESTPRGG